MSSSSSKSKAREKLEARFKKVHESIADLKEFVVEYVDETIAEHQRKNTEKIEELRKQVSELQSKVNTLVQQSQPPPVTQRTPERDNSKPASAPVTTATPNPPKTPKKRLTLLSEQISQFEETELDENSISNSNELNSVPIKEKDIPKAIMFHNGYKAQGTRKYIPFCTWLERVLSLGDDLNWSSTNKRLCIQLRSSGQLLNFVTRPDVRKLNFSQYISALVKEFGANEELRSALILNSIQQGSHECISDFNERFFNAIVELDMDEPQKVLAYIKALSPSFKKAFTQLPTTLAEAFDFARSVEVINKLDRKSDHKHRSISHKRYDYSSSSEDRYSSSDDYSSSNDSYRRNSRSRGYSSSNSNHDYSSDDDSNSYSDSY